MGIMAFEHMILGLQKDVIDLQNGNSIEEIQPDFLLQCFLHSFLEHHGGSV